MLYDFSSCARQALRVAHLWSQWAGVELHLFHNLDGSYTPAMATQEVVQQVYAYSKADAFNEMQRNYQEITGEPVQPQNVHVAVDSLASTLNQLILEHHAQLLFTGLQGHGILKRLLIGSTVFKLLEHVTIPIVAIPKRTGTFQQVSLHVSISYHYAFNTSALQHFLLLLGTRIETLVLLSVLTEDDDRQQATSHLEKVKASLTTPLDVVTCLFEGDNPLKQVKAYMQKQADGVLVLQRRSRALSEYFYREFFINELVHDANLPLIILPS